MRHGASLLTVSLLAFLGSVGCSSGRTISPSEATSMLDAWGVVALPHGSVLSAVDRSGPGPDPSWRITIQLNDDQATRFVARNSALVDRSSERAWTFVTESERTARFSCSLHGLAADRYKLDCGL